VAGARPAADAEDEEDEEEVAAADDFDWGGDEEDASIAGTALPLVDEGASADML
jgi:hypothetical protein